MWVSLLRCTFSVSGWVCYAEKTHGSLVIPHISTTKSPQQIMGSLVKDRLAPELGKTPDSVYHVTLMPCYDKKLEASREDFTNQQLHTRDVDCVITASERILILIFHMHSSVSTPKDPCQPASQLWNNGNYRETQPYDLSFKFCLLLIRPTCLWRWSDNITITMLDIIHCPVFYLIHQISKTETESSMQNVVF
jgi:hypothetical protein